MEDKLFNFDDDVIDSTIIDFIIEDGASDGIKSCLDCDNKSEVECQHCPSYLYW